MQESLPELNSELSDVEKFHWRDLKECDESTADLFFATDSRETRQTIEAAKRICQSCRVASVCLQYALDTKEEYGVWGGKTAKERKDFIAYQKDTRERVVAADDPQFEDKAWRKGYNMLPNEMNVYSIGVFLKMHGDWVTNMAEKLNITPIATKAENGATQTLYPKTLVRKLYAILQQTPSSDRWLTTSAIAKQLKLSYNVAHRAIQRSDIASEDRRSETTGMVRKHYPPEIVDRIKHEMQSISAKGNWLSLNELSRQLNKDIKWVAKRVKERFSELGELRYDVNTRRSIHYPPEVYESLRQEANDRPDIQDKEAHISLYGLVRAINHDEKWIKRRIPYTGFVAKNRLNPRNRQVWSYYPIEIIDALRALPDDILTRDNQ